MDHRPEDVKRFFRYVEKLPNGCWYWTGARSRGKGNRKWYGSATEPSEPTGSPRKFSGVRPARRAITATTCAIFRCALTQTISKSFPKK